MFLHSILLQISSRFLLFSGLSSHYPREFSFPTLHLNVFYGKTTFEKQNVLADLDPQQYSDVGIELWTLVQNCFL